MCYFAELIISSITQKEHYRGILLRSLSEKTEIREQRQSREQQDQAGI
jgi:hypothetical protein